MWTADGVSKNNGNPRWVGCSQGEMAKTGFVPPSQKDVVANVERETLRQREEERLRTERDLRVVTIPYPRAVEMNGERLPASYVNFYVANGVVLVPTFNDRNDPVALGIVAELFADREVIGIHAVDLVWGLGTLHCLTQQQPAPPRTT